MPSHSKAQSLFFKSVYRCKKDPDYCDSKLKKTADNMSKSQIKDFFPIENTEMKFKDFVEKSNHFSCECTCPSCLKGDCGGCTCQNCKCKNCHCGQ